MNYKIYLDKLGQINTLIRTLGLDKPDASTSFYEYCCIHIVSPEIRKSCLKLFRDGHNEIAIANAYKAVNNYVKKKSSLTGKDGVPLMQAAFSANNPMIKLNNLSNTSEIDEQIGYMNIFAGCMAAIRNPRIHEDNYDDSDETTYKLLLFADHLIQKLESIK